MSTGKAFLKGAFPKSITILVYFVIQESKENGKTYSAIDFLIDRKKEKNYTIITNVKSFNVFNDTLYMNDIMDIINYCKEFKDNDKNVIIFFDEIFTILEKQTRINKEILSFISQLRKRHIIFVTTAQEWSEINITFRRYVRYQISFNMFSLPFFHTAFIFNSINDGDQIHWDNDSQEFIAPRISANFAKCNRAVVQSYDTFETIKTQ